MTKHLGIKRVPNVDRHRKITVPCLAARRARAHFVNAPKVLRTLPTSGPPGAPFGANDRTHVHTVLAYRATFAGVELLHPGDVVPFLDGVAPDLGHRRFRGETSEARRPRAITPPNSFRAFPRNVVDQLVTGPLLLDASRNLELLPPLAVPEVVRKPQN